MKTKIYIDIRNDKGEIIKKTYKSDYDVINDLYVTFEPKKVKQNVKTFEINKRKALNDKDMGIQYSKVGHCVIMTIGVLFGKKNVYAQLLIGKDLDKTKVIDCDDVRLCGVKPYILDAIDLANVITMADLDKLDRLK